MENFVIQFPVWDLKFFGGGFLIATIASFHVFIAHFAVGGGLFLVVTEYKGYKENSHEIISYTKKHSNFFMITTLVLGAITGVAIWFVIGLLNPSATSFLVNNFVFAWATEWVFFLCEIISIFLYFYLFGKITKKTHMLLGAMYFIFAWLSLFVINGIIAFMLTPGDFIETKNFWDGFFNPGFFPSLFFRTALAVMIAGLFGLFTSSRIDNNDTRLSMTRYCSKWVVLSVIALVITSHQYLNSMPSAQKAMILENSPEIFKAIRYFSLSLIIIALVALLINFKLPQRFQKLLTVTLLIFGLTYISSFEMIREAARRPFILYGIIYSNSIQVSKVESVKENGILKSYRWSKNKEITDENLLSAGGELFNISCSQCHSNGGLMNDINKYTKDYSKFGLEALLTGIGKRSSYMPPFYGKNIEKKALAEYLFKIAGSHETVVKSPVLKDVKPHDFDYKKDNYVLLSWTDKGMNYIPGKNEIIKINDTIINIHATLIRRGETPESIQDVKLYLRFENEKEFLPFEFDDDTGSFVLSIETSKLKKNPNVYRSADVYALKNSESLDKLNDVTKTSLIIPVSNETSCYTCHDYSNFDSKNTGISKTTSFKILKTHDRLNRTNLFKKANKGEIVECKSCHDDSTNNLTLSASMHGFHSIYLKGKGSVACNSCHSLSTNGKSKGFRGVHNGIELECINCHGTIEDVALPLLLSEDKANKKGSKKLIKLINNKSIKSMKPRRPWVNEPDCLFCHVDFNEPEMSELEVNSRTAGSDDLFSRKMDDAGIMCAACHGSQHSLYPANNKLNNSRANLQPKQYQNNPYTIAANKNCKICHRKAMKEERHHPNSLRYFRNTVD
ncbi:MAG: cytochrome C [Desulfobacterales bacterium]|nr:cytochrome C [Desulfobacterales bacterium]MCP4159803.1 cytochrome C [Deltaproteobacteria bacterium]